MGRNTPSSTISASEVHSMQNDLQEDISALATIERLKKNKLLNEEDFTELRHTLRTEWARTTADALASGIELDADSESILERFSSVRRRQSAT